MIVKLRGECCKRKFQLYEMYENVRYYKIKNMPDPYGLCKRI
jgi:hypothetical protein